MGCCKSCLKKANAAAPQQQQPRAAPLPVGTFDSDLKGAGFQMADTAPTNKLAITTDARLNTIQLSGQWELRAFVRSHSNKSTTSSFPGMSFTGSSGNTTGAIVEHPLKSLVVGDSYRLYFVKQGENLLVREAGSPDTAVLRLGQWGTVGNFSVSVHMTFIPGENDLKDEANRLAQHLLATVGTVPAAPAQPKKKKAATTSILPLTGDKIVVQGEIHLQRQQPLQQSTVDSSEEDDDESAAVAALAKAKAAAAGPLPVVAPKADSKADSKSPAASKLNEKTTTTHSKKKAIESSSSSSSSSE